MQQVRPSQLAVQITTLLALIILAAGTALSLPMISDPARSVAPAPEDAPAPSLLPADFSQETIYFILVDRFCDGNPANNPPPPLFSPDRSRWKLYWGGDLQGIIDRLDYLREMGISAIWISPLVRNTESLYRYGNDELAAFHGYWGRDFKQINPYLGSWEDLDRLVGECHQRDIKVILDIVLNHTSPINQGIDGALFDDGKFIGDYSHDQEMIFHHNGTVDFSSPRLENWQNRNLFDLADLAQENPRVENYLEESYSAWLDHGIDSFRIDTARYIPAVQMAAFGRAMIRKKPDLFIFGEWSEGGADVPQAVDFVRESGIPILDFRLQYVINQVLNHHAPFQDLQRLLAFDHNLPDPAQMVTFVDNHDMPRFMTNAISAGAGEAEARRRLELAITLVMTLRGIPCIYYGSEQYLHNDTRSEWGVGAEPYNRQMMTGFDSTTRLYSIIRKLSDLRRLSPALGRGSPRIIMAREGRLVFERRHGREVVLVAINRDSATPFTIKTHLPDGDYRSRLYAGRHALLGPSITVKQNQTIIRLPALGSGVWYFSEKADI